MSGGSEKALHLTEMARRMRLDALDMALAAGGGGSHVGGSLSCIEILAVLYGEVLRMDPKNPLDVNRDRLGRADVDQIERVFGAGSDFMKQVTTLAQKLSDNAGAGASSFASLYSASGSPYSSYMANNYDYFG